MTAEEDAAQLEALLKGALGAGDEADNNFRRFVKATGSKSPMDLFGLVLEDLADPYLTLAQQYRIRDLNKFHEETSVNDWNRVTRLNFEEWRKEHYRRFTTPRSPQDFALSYEPPSVGKEPKEESGPKGSPSSDEGMEEGLDRVADSPSIRVSSNSVAIEFVEDLHKIATHREIDEKFITAAKYVRGNWHHPRFMKGKKGVFKNTRWFTGIVCNALNLVLQAYGGLVALHHGCIGSGSTHSGISVSAVGPLRSPPLLVCEGRQDSDVDIRAAVRGQLFNELVRHRRIFAGGSEQTDFRPVLLMALNSAYVSVELAFPTTKNGYLKRNEWIAPSSSAPGDVIFFTIQIAFIDISDEPTGREKLAKLFCFLKGALKKLHDMKEYKRDQWKTPWVDSFDISKASKCGDNVTVVDKKWVYKEFCYYLRQEDGFNSILYDGIAEKDQRKPPPNELLQALGKPYSDWASQEYADGWFTVLKYSFIQGDSQATIASWVSLLRRIAIIHENEYVHGDILPRNVIFSDDEGYIIDFDLTRREGHKYVSGYNHKDFSMYRHPEARALWEMKREHDVHALAAIGKGYFGDVIPNLPAYDQASTINDLLNFFGSVKQNV